MPRIAKPLVVLVMLMTGAGLGLAVAIQVVAMIRDARAIGMYGPATTIAIQAATGKPVTEQEERLAYALAAAIDARSPADCRNLAPEHWPGCRTYVEQREELVPTR